MSVMQQYIENGYGEAIEVVDGEIRQTLDDRVVTTVPVDMVKHVVPRSELQGWAVTVVVPSRSARGEEPNGRIAIRMIMETGQDAQDARNRIVEWMGR